MRGRFGRLPGAGRGSGIRFGIRRNIKAPVTRPPLKNSCSQHNIYAIGQANSAPCMPIGYKLLIMHGAA